MKLVATFGATGLNYIKGDSCSLGVIVSSKEFATLTDWLETLSVGEFNVYQSKDDTLTFKWEAYDLVIATAVRKMYKNLIKVLAVSGKLVSLGNLNRYGINSRHLNYYAVNKRLQPSPEMLFKEAKVLLDSARVIQFKDPDLVHTLDLANSSSAYVRYTNMCIKHILETTLIPDDFRFTSRQDTLEDCILHALLTKGSGSSQLTVGLFNDRGYVTPEEIVQKVIDVERAFIQSGLTKSIRPKYSIGRLIRSYNSYVDRAVQDFSNRFFEMVTGNKPVDFDLITQYDLLLSGNLKSKLKESILTITHQYLTEKKPNVLPDRLLSTVLMKCAMGNYESLQQAIEATELNYLTNSASLITEIIYTINYNESAL